MATDPKKPLDVGLFLTSQIILLIPIIPVFLPSPAKVITLAGLGWYYYRVVFTKTTGNFHLDYLLGSMHHSHFMVILDLALLTPHEELRNFHDKDRTKVTQRPLKDRFIWALELLSNPRGIGWAHELSNLPPHWPSLSSSRSRFVVSRIFLTIVCFLLSAGANTFQAAYANTTTAGKLVTGAPFHWRVLLVLSFGLGGACMLCGVNTIFSAGLVACGLSSPESWPLAFGSPLQAWSIRRFWRRCWHQMTRRWLLSHTSFILGCFFPANYVGTTSYNLALLYTAFFISAIIHLSGDVMATGKLGFKSFTFFMLQPFGITIEIVVSYLWRRLQRDQSSRHKTTVNLGSAAERKDQNGNPSNQNGKSFVQAEESIPVWIRCVGLIWVTLWMGWTAAYMVDLALVGHMLPANRGQI